MAVINAKSDLLFKGSSFNPITLTKSIIKISNIIGNIFSKDEKVALNILKYFTYIVCFIFLVILYFYFLSLRHKPTVSVYYL